ncbi:hypothetical protein [Allokutzneria albata]|uniref:Alpha-L-rhamnosidase n=1 Tax=Allokutzneria albata TaxID=211114 RepID=A0A1G9RZY7_ALLAB|nr:hypothetical protein [Allokutzneria albata]SDM28783.1 hypothetical protein SAMN04489726_0803 [Allokutzneria albata]
MSGIPELLARFTDPAPEYGPLPIWWWSGAKVTRERLREQMEKLVAGGVRQAVVLCLAPTGPMFGSVADDPAFLTPEWIELFDGACADAEELGFTLWLYDQIGFSGANFQGRLISANPGFSGQALYHTVAETSAELAVSPPEGHEALAAYAILPSGERTAVPLAGGAAQWAGGPARVVLVHSGASGFDYFSTKACAALLDTVHGTLERGVGHWFGRSIGGFFQDELPAMPTWGSDFASTFADAYGYDIIPMLWALWEDDASPEAVRVRRDYHAHRASLARRGFFDQHDEWYRSRGLICGFDQATPAREGDPAGGVRLYGDYLDTHSGYGAPGSDHWGDAKVHSSLAHANGHGRTWIEAFHSSGWGGTLQETYDWLAPFLRRGANLYDPHAVYYSTVGGWWEWAPPSTCWRQPYWPSYHVFSTAVSRLCSVLTAGQHVCDVVLLSPTSTVQGHLTLDGPLPAAHEANEAFLALNGVGTWFAEKRGVLEKAGIDHDVFDEATIASASVLPGGRLRVGEEEFRTVVLPAVHTLHAAAAHRLLDFIAEGGRVVCVGRVPELFLDGVVDEFPVTLVDSVDDVPAAIHSGPVRVSADAPYLLRRVGDAYVLALTAHDDVSGTAAPMLDLGEGYWWSNGVEFDWQGYNEQLRTRGYSFRAPGDRVAHVQISGVSGVRAQSWAPGRGTRTELAIGPDGSFEVPFDDGSVALVVLSPSLPPATAVPFGAVESAVEITGPWTGLAKSTLDNSRGDLAAPSRTGVLPIEIWQLSHGVEDSWEPVVASYGPFASVHDGDGVWRPVEWSLARGIRKDPLHSDTLGPKGQVPEEFLDWRNVRAGQTVAVRTHVALAEAAHLVVGATAPRRVLLNGVELPVSGEGHQTVSPLASGGELIIELTATQSGPLRASFAVVTDVAAYLRPEWIRPDSPVVIGATHDMSLSFQLEAVPASGSVLVGSDGACSVLINGVEVGRQGDFNPYPEHREIRLHTYDLAAHLRVGSNTVVLRVTHQSTHGTAATLDSASLGIRSGPGWTSAVQRRDHRRDPRFVCAYPRPHPLPGASWLDPAVSSSGVVVPVIPDIAPGPPRTEKLRFTVPPGTVSVRIPSTLDMYAVFDSQEIKVEDGVLRLPSPARAGASVTLFVSAVDGRRGGALLDGPLEVSVVEAEFPLGDWATLGLRNLGGEVRYRTTFTASASGRRVLDLGSVRGAVSVEVNGSPAGELVWGPWRVDVSELLVEGENVVEVVVRGTLAGYLDDASPTSGVYAGQVRSGLFGPVRLLSVG